MRYCWGFCFFFSSSSSSYKRKKRGRKECKYHSFLSITNVSQWQRSRDSSIPEYTLKGTSGDESKPHLALSQPRSLAGDDSTPPVGARCACHAQHQSLGQQRLGVDLPWLKARKQSHGTIRAGETRRRWINSSTRIESIDRSIDRQADI